MEAEPHARAVRCGLFWGLGLGMSSWLPLAQFPTAQAAFDAWAAGYEAGNVPSSMVTLEGEAWTSLRSCAGSPTPNEPTNNSFGAMADATADTALESAPRWACALLTAASEVEFPFPGLVAAFAPDEDKTCVLRRGDAVVGIAASWTQPPCFSHRVPVLAHGSDLTFTCASASPPERLELWFGDAAPLWKPHVQRWGGRSIGLPLLDGSRRTVVVGPEGAPTAVVVPRAPTRS